VAFHAHEDDLRGSSRNKRLMKSEHKKGRSRGKRGRELMERERRRPMS